MNETSSSSTHIVRTSRGLSVANTRITLYDVMDYVTQGWPHDLIQYWLNLNDEQMADAMAYIENNRAEVESEYQQVLQYNEELRQYYETRTQERFAKIRALPPKPGYEELITKIQTAKANMGMI